MELTNNELVTAHQALLSLAQERMPIKIGWSLAQMIVRLEQHVKAFMLMRDSLMMRYEIDTKLQGTDEVIISSKKDGNAQKFGAELNELLALSVEIEIDKIKLPNTLKVAPSILVPLTEFVEMSVHLKQKRKE